MADEEMPAAAPAANYDSDSSQDDEYSAFLDLLKAPTITPAPGPHAYKNVVEGGAHLLQLAVGVPAVKEEEEEDSQSTAPMSPSNANAAATKPSQVVLPEKRDYRDLIKEKQQSSKKLKKKKKKPDVPPATVSQVLSFLPTTGDRALLFAGVVSGILNGLVYPILAYVFSNSFSDLGGAASGLGQVREIAFTFLGVGAYAFAVAALQNFFFLIASHRAADNFKRLWFKALLRQDAAFHDVHSVSGMATALSSASTKMKRGLGRKLGEGVQFGTTFFGGIVYAFWSS
jgi:ATP-binding cassette subfamily B (MDR/TAP) protein 1